MENEEIGELLLELAKETRAIRDVMALMCFHLRRLSPESAADAAEMLEGVATNTRYQPTPSFVSVATHVAAALRGHRDGVDLPSLSATPNRLDREELRQLLKVVPAGHSPEA